MVFYAIPSDILHYSVRQEDLLRSVPVALRPLDESAMAVIDPLDDAGRSLDIETSGTANGNSADRDTGFLSP